MNLCRVCLLFLLLTLTSCTQESRPLKLLFIGNSLTYGNSLPAMLEQFRGHNTESPHSDSVQPSVIPGRPLSCGYLQRAGNRAFLDLSAPYSLSH